MGTLLARTHVHHAGTHGTRFNKLDWNTSFKKYCYLFQTVISFETLALPVSRFLIAFVIVASVKKFPWNLIEVPVSFFRFSFLIKFAKYLLIYFRFPYHFSFCYCFHLILRFACFWFICKKGFTAAQNCHIVIVVIVVSNIFDVYIVRVISFSFLQMFMQMLRCFL